MQPFQPYPLSTTQLNLSAAQQDVPLLAYRDAPSVMIDNRGSTDVLIEFDAPPQDAKSFRVAPMCAQVISSPHKAKVVSLKRPEGSAVDIVYVSLGTGV